MLKEKTERLLQLEHMCSVDEINSSNSSRGKPLLEDLIREEILRSKAREKEEKPNNLSKVDGRQVISFISFLKLSVFISELILKKTHPRMMN